MARCFLSDKGPSLAVLGLSLGLGASAALAERVEVADISLPEGFTASVFAEVGPARHLVVSDAGTLYVRLRGGGIVALADEDGDGVADREEEFGDFAGTGIRLHGDWLYASSDDAVYRFALEEEDFIPSGEAELVAGGFPDQRQHATKSFVIDGEGRLLVNVGAPSNACQETMRTAGSPGAEPCRQLDRQAGIWRFETGVTGQDQRRDGVRHATGIRNAVAIAYSRGLNAVYFVNHGRDQLSALWPELYSDEENAVLPAEEFHRLEAGADYGWPHTYYHGERKARIIAPEYGGDSEREAETGRYVDPLISFPAHWAPNDLVFYEADAFPAAYRGGAFIAFHGSWNRAPLPQAGFNIVFVPFDDIGPSGDWEVFAEGFAGSDRVRSPRQADYRPTGLAVGPDGALYVADTMKGRIWRITWVGE